MQPTNGVPSANGHAPPNRVAVIPLPERLPPQNLEAERGALGSVLIEPARFAEVAALADADDFYRDAHQVIYRAMRALHDAGIPPDATLVADELERRGQLDRIGGLFALGELTTATPHAANARYYAGIVRTLARKRGLLEAADETLRRCYDPAHGPDAILARVREHLARVEATGAGLAPEAPAEVASLADVRRQAAETRWLWPGWIVDAHLTVLAAEPGVGKTRLTLDLCRRLWGALAWPDGELAARPPGTPSLWVAADRNHAELLHAAREFGLPDEAVRFNAPPADPFGGLKLDEPADVAALGRRVRAVRPGFLVVDTINKATRRLLYRPEEAEAFFGPLLDLARAERVPILALTHLSRGGDPLDRRIEGICRALWKLECPDPEGQPLRRKLRVTKSNALYPAALGVTMGDAGNDYDASPPEPPEATPGGRPNAALQAAVDWLRDRLTFGAARAGVLIDEAEAAGHARRTLYRARDLLGVRPEEGGLWRLPGGDGAGY